MSYDLQVYAPKAVSTAELRALVSDAGLGIDDGEPGQALTVVPGARRAYSFTPGLPVQAETEDVPEEVTAVLLDARVMYELLVEGSSTTESRTQSDSGAVSRRRRAARCLIARPTRCGHAASFALHLAPRRAP